MKPMTRFAPPSRNICGCRGPRPFGLAAALAGLVAAACVDNGAPVVTKELSVADLLVGDSLAVDLAGHFEDPDGDALWYEAGTSAPAAAGVAVAGGVLTVTALALGEAAVTVTAHDPGGLAANQEFMVTVAFWRLTTNWARDVDPAWSPDGARIAFTSDRRPREWWIHVMDADGSDVERLKRLTNRRGVAGDPAWSPDGTRIAFVDDVDIYVMDADGSGVEWLTNYGARGPAWSPDGARIAFESGPSRDIYVMNADGSGVKRLTNNKPYFPWWDENPAWSPDGTRIAFASDRDGHWEIYVMDADGSGVERLTNHGARNVEPAWSPDGTRIAFASDRDGHWEIYVMDADGSGVERLTNHGARNVDPAWSPDGTRIAFASDRDGEWEIYVMRVATP